MSDCARCRTRGKPAHFGSDPKCAFVEDVFDSDNWQCATMNALRDKAEEGEADETGYPLWSEDQNAALIARDGQYIALSWYKNRGRTEGAWLMYESHIEPLSLKDAERFLGDKEIVIASETGSNDSMWVFPTFFGPSERKG